MQKTPHSRARQGAALVEFAVCLPVILLIFFAGMDITTLLRTNQAVVQAAHETARIIATNEVDEVQCRQFATDLLSRDNLSNPTIQFDPVPTPNMRRGTSVTVSISIPVADNCTVISQLYTSLTLSSRTTVSREIGDLTRGQILKTDE